MSQKVRKKLKKKTSDFVSSSLPNSLYLKASLISKKLIKKLIKVRLKLPNFPRILQNYLIFNVFFSKMIVKIQEKVWKIKKKSEKLK